MPKLVTGMLFLAPFPFRRFAAHGVIVLLIFMLAGCLSGRQLEDRLAMQSLLADKGVAVYTAGDIAECKNYRPEDSGAWKNAAIIAAGLAADPHAVVLTLGDHTYPSGLPAEFADCYDPTWGRFKAKTYPSPGNHEYYTAGAVGYYGYFRDAAGPDRRGYYSFTLGNWHIISMNSYLQPQQHQAQLAWLRQDLQAHPSHCTLAFWHHPLYSSGGNGSSLRMRDAWRILQAAGAELVLASHDHDYERFAPQDAEGNRDDKTGMTQFVVGTGGATLTPFHFRKFHSQASDNSTLGVLKLVLKERGYEWEFLPVAGGGFTDRGAALCH